MNKILRFDRSICFRGKICFTSVNLSCDISMITLNNAIWSDEMYTKYKKHKKFISYITTCTMLVNARRISCIMVSSVKFKTQIYLFIKVKQVSHHMMITGLIINGRKWVALLSAAEAIIPYWITDWSPGLMSHAGVKLITLLSILAHLLIIWESTRQDIRCKIINNKAVQVRARIDKVKIHMIKGNSPHLY